MLPEPDDCTPAHPDTLGARNPLLPAAVPQLQSGATSLNLKVPLVDHLHSDSRPAVAARRKTAVLKLVQLQSRACSPLTAHRPPLIFLLTARRPAVREGLRHLGLSPQGLKGLNTGRQRRVERGLALITTQSHRVIAVRASPSQAGGVLVRPRRVPTGGAYFGRGRADAAGGVGPQQAALPVAAEPVAARYRARWAAGPDTMYLMNDDSVCTMRLEITAPLFGAWIKNANFYGRVLWRRKTPNASYTTTPGTAALHESTASAGVSPAPCRRSLVVRSHGVSEQLGGPGEVPTRTAYCHHE